MTRYGGRLGSRTPTPRRVVGDGDDSRGKLVGALEGFEEEDLGDCKAEILEAEVTDGYRQRCRFSLRGSPLEYVMFDGTDEAIIGRFDLASERVNRLMPVVLSVVRGALGVGIRAVHIHAPRLETSEPVVTLVYGAAIDEIQWPLDAKAGRLEILNAIGERIHFVGRAKGLTLRSDASSVLEELDFTNDDRVTLEFPEGSFSHPNTRANERSVAWLRNRLRSIIETVVLLELYCGAGNHTTCLAPFCTRVLAVEMDPILVDAANRNLHRNHVTNATVLAADAQRFSKTLLRKKRQSHDYNVVLVDPPRRGLDKTTLQLLSHFHHVLYVSCNPTALRADLISLRSSHHVAAFALLDAFPSTPHLECLAHLVRNSLPPSDVLS